MATISANALGIYYMPTIDAAEVGYPNTSSDSTVPYGIAHKTATTTYTETSSWGDDVVAEWDNLTFDDSDWGYKILLNVDGTFDSLVFKYTTTKAFALAQQPELISAATSTSLEASNTVNETTASNGDGTSTTYIVGGAMSWSMSVDGLLDLSTAGVGSSVDIMDAALSKLYVLCKFDTGTTTGYVGQALIESVSFSGGVDDIATYSASLSGYGDLYKY